MIGIAISGRSGSGKTALAERIEGVAPQATRISFANALKMEVWNRYGLRKEDPGGRDRLIDHGNRRRAGDPLYWVSRFEERRSMAELCGLHVVCDDLRFQREYDYLARLGFLLVRISAPDDVRAARLAQQGLDPAHVYATDPGEMEMTDGHRWHVRVWNDSPDALANASLLVVDQATQLHSLRLSARELHAEARPETERFQSA